MGFGKFIKDVAGGIQNMNDERNERKRREQVKDFQRNEHIAAGKFCKGCGRTGEFDSQCTDCLKFPFCNNCYLSNQRFGIKCLHCCGNYLCKAQGCSRLSDDDCISCKRQICQTHWGALFLYNKNQFFTCAFHKGNVCKFCVEQGKTGTFKKHFTCLKCGNELHQKMIN